MLPIYDVDCVVAGAGVVGLAIARAMALEGREVLIIERASLFGSETSARNSEVIHAGIYYPQGSLKAACCVDGKWALYDYLESRHIPHKKCQKLIVATDQEEADQLASIKARAATNGVDDLRYLTGADACALEPALLAEAALLSPSTGIIDSHAYMTSLLGEAEDNGAVLVLETEIVGGEVGADGRTELECAGKDPCRIRAKTFVNSAGLGAPELARSIAGFGAAHVPQDYLAKGNYFTLSGAAPFQRLIYPVPVAGGLGVHLTLDLGGQARFGPDVEWIETIDYAVDPSRSAGFYDAIRRYWPDLQDASLQPAYSGIRPKIAGPGEPNADFEICGPRTHGIAGQVHLFGIESPGLTSSLELASRVVAEVKSVEA